MKMSKKPDIYSAGPECIELFIIANFKIIFHPAKFDNFKDGKMSDYQTVSVAQSQNLLVSNYFQLLVWQSFSKSNLRQLARYSLIQ
jgi:hypothetical protein